jgi:hypothetical protein
MNAQDRNQPVPGLWVSPVHVRIGFGIPETINNPLEGLDYLLNRWPAERGFQYEKAKAACTSAIQRCGSTLEEAREAFAIAAERDGSLEEARDAFVAAAMEAHILD